MTRALFLLLLLAGVALAGGTPLEEAQEALQAEKQRLTQLSDSDSPDAKTWRKEIEGRIVILEELVEIREEAASLPEIDELTREKSRLDEGIAAARQKAVPESVELSSPRETTVYSQKLAAAEKERDTRQKALETMTERRKGVTEEAKRLKERGIEAAGRLEALVGEDDLTRYRAETARIEQLLTSEGSEFLKTAVTRWESWHPVLKLELDMATFSLERSRKELNLALEEAALLREDEAKRGREEAERQKREAELERDPLERFRREVEATVTTCKSVVSEQKSLIERVRQEVQEMRTTIDRMLDERKHIEKRIRFEDERLSDLLLNAYRRIERSRLRILQVQRPRLRDQLAENQSSLVDLLDELWVFEAPEDENRYIAELLEKLPEERHEEARRVFRQAVQGADGLLPAIESRRDTLEEAGRQLGLLDDLSTDYLDGLDSFSSLLTTRLYFIRNEPALGLGTLVRAGSEAATLVRSYLDPEIWKKVGKAYRVDPLRIAGSALSLLLLVAGIAAALVHRRHRRAAGEEADFPRRRDWLWVLVAPVALFLSGFVLEGLGLPPQLSEAIPSLLGLAALFLLLRGIALHVLRVEGPAGRLLTGRPEAIRLLARATSALTLAALVFVAPEKVLASPPFTFVDLPRLLDTAFTIVLAATLIALVRPKGALAQSWTRPKSFARRVWAMLAPLVSLTYLIVVAMDVLGFRLGANVLGRNTSLTVAALLIAGAGYTILVRLIEAAASKVRRRSVGPDEEASTSAVRQQLTRLVAAAGMFALAVSLLRFWGTQFLMLGYLEEIRIVMRSDGDWLTLLDVMVALLWLGGGHFVVANLSAAFEHFFFPFVGQAGRGTRYVALTLTRYSVILIAYSAALLTVGFQFSSLAWLFAAVSVGLGFGLQEIVANFVSGLILLIEQPIRIGDIITVGQTGGTVDKITIRATVVTNWDRQSIVIPNKNFITQNLTNWTRNDDVMRRRLSLSVPHGTDVQRLFEILTESVKSHPKVLEDPPSRVWLDGFGDAGMNLEIWVFTKISDGLVTRTELYKQIVVRLAEEGIEISVPRRDFRVTGDEDQQSLGRLLEPEPGPEA